MRYYMEERAGLRPRTKRARGQQNNATAETRRASGARMQITVWIFAALATLGACEMKGETTNMSSSALGASPDAGSPKKKVPPQDGFVQVLPGAAAGTVIGVGDASPWGVGTDANIYHYSSDYQYAAPPATARTFLMQSNSPQSSTGTTSIAVSPEGRPWKIDAAGQVWKHSGSPPYEAAGTWTPIGTIPMYEVSVGKNDIAWAISRVCFGHNCEIYQLSGSDWADSGFSGSHIAVSPDGLGIYGTSTNGSIAKWNGTSFQPFLGGGCANHTTDTIGWPVIGAGSNDDLWVIGCTQGAGGNDVEYYSKQSNAWFAEPNAYATTVSVSADGTPWVINSGGAIFEYVTQWTNVGPNGFSFVDSNGITQTYTGEIHDVDVNGRTGTVMIGARAGGVWWYNASVSSWFDLGGLGAGVGLAQQQAPAEGPVEDIGTLAVNPSNTQHVVVGTGIGNHKVNGPEQNGNGAWWTDTAQTSAPTWSPSIFNNGIATPTKFVKIRYMGTSSTLYAISPSNLYVSTDDGHSFTQQSCTPPPGEAFTDLVFDPRRVGYAFLGVSGEGVYQAAPDGTCIAGSPPPLYTGGPTTITDVALAISGRSTLYAAFAGSNNSDGQDFQNIDAATVTSWPVSWQPTVLASSLLGQPGLNSQGGHDWALGTDPTGQYLLLGGVNLFRGTGCTGSGCTTFQEVVNQPQHSDYQSIAWGRSANVYVANDGGIFRSLNNGSTWTSMNNGLNVSEEMGVSVNGGNIFAAAWDVGLNWTTNAANNTSPTWQGGIVGDGAQAVADRPGSPSGFFCFEFAEQRYRWDGTSIYEIDNPIAPVVEAQPARMAQGLYGPLFTTAPTLNAILESFNEGASWQQYQSNIVSGSPTSVVASNENPPTIYSITGENTFVASVGGGDWTYLVAPWSSNQTFASATWSLYGSGAAVVTNPDTSDVYAADVSAFGAKQPEVWMSPVVSHGTTWLPMTGTTTAAPGVPGMLKSDEAITTVLVDPSSRALLVGADGIAPTSSIYGAATLWRLNNPDVDDAYHHWRPWILGLPNGEQPISWLAGQYEYAQQGPGGGTGGLVYYIYVATYGRAIYKRQVRGGDL